MPTREMPFLFPAQQLKFWAEVDTDISSKPPQQDQSLMSLLIEDFIFVHHHFVTCHTLCMVQLDGSLLTHSNHVSYKSLGNISFLFPGRLETENNGTSMRQQANFQYLLMALFLAVRWTEQKEVDVWLLEDDSLCEIITTSLSRSGIAEGNYGRMEIFQSDVANAVDSKG